MSEKMSKKDRELVELARKVFENQSKKARVELDHDGYKCSSCERLVRIGDNYCSSCGKELNWKFAHDTIGLHRDIVFGGARYEIEDISWEERWAMPDELTITAKEILPGEEET